MTEISTVPYPLAHTKQESGIYITQSGGIYQVSGVYGASAEINSGIHVITSGSAASGVITGTPMLGGSLALASGFSGIGFSGMQRIPFEDTGHYTVWRSGGGVYAMRTQTGVIEYSGDNEISGITWAIQHLDDTATGTAMKGGVVYIKKGTYNLSGEISIVGDSGNTNSNVIIRGDGLGTSLRFRNSGVGIRINNMTQSVFEDFRVIGSVSGLRHLFHIENDALRNSVSNVWIEGVSASGVAARGTAEESGQVGMYFAGESGTAQYQWKVDKVTFNQLDMAVLLNVDVNGLVQGANQNYFDQCFINNTQIGFRVRGSMNMITNLGMQGTVGTGLIGIDIQSGAQHNMINNISTELLASGAFAVKQNPVGAPLTTLLNINNTQSQSNVVQSGIMQVHSMPNFRAGFASSATVTAGNSGAFGPAEWVTVQVSGVLRKIPVFAV